MYALKSGTKKHPEFMCSKGGRGRAGALYVPLAARGHDTPSLQHICICWTKKHPELIDGVHCVHTSLVC